MTRALTALAGLVAVVAGIGSAIGWINEHVNDQIVWVTGLLILTAVCVAWVWASAADSAGPRRPRYVGYAVATFAVIVLAGIIFDDDISDFVNGYIFAAAAIVPPGVELYLKDRRSRRECPDCREQIRADANVCKHCGFRFRARPEIGQTAAPDNEFGGSGRSQTRSSIS